MRSPWRPPHNSHLFVDSLPATRSTRPHHRPYRRRPINSPLPSRRAMQVDCLSKPRPRHKEVTVARGTAPVHPLHPPHPAPVPAGEPIACLATVIFVKSSACCASSTAGFGSDTRKRRVVGVCRCVGCVCGHYEFRLRCARGWGLAGGEGRAIIPRRERLSDL